METNSGFIMSMAIVQLNETNEIIVHGQRICGNGTQERHCERDQSGEEDDCPHIQRYSSFSVFSVDHSMAVRCLCFSPSSRLYTGSDDKSIISYNVLTKESVVEHTYSGHSGWVTGVSISADEQYLASW